LLVRGAAGSIGGSAMRDRCSYHEPHTRNKSADVGARQTHRTARRDFSSKAQVRTRPRWLCAALLCGAIVGGIIGTAYAAKKIPPIAGPMYLTAYASVVTGQSKNAVKPLSYLAVADPSIADVQNALALALFTTDPSKHAIAHAHAKKAVGMAPDVPQFTYTMVLTDTKQWKISGDGTARLTREAAKVLLEVSKKLKKGKSNEKKLGKLLAKIEESGGDPNFPYVLPKYQKLIKSPKLAFTRPSKAVFARAQKAIEQKVFTLKDRLKAETVEAKKRTVKAEARKTEIDKKVAEATLRQKEVEGAKARALENLRLAASVAAKTAKRLAELTRFNQYLAEVDERLYGASNKQKEEELRLAKAKRKTEACLSG
jgi:hypothetical protein